MLSKKWFDQVYIICEYNETNYVTIECSKGQDPRKVKASRRHEDSTHKEIR